MADQFSLEPQQSMMPGAGAGVAADATFPASVFGIMTEPVVPILGLHELFATPPAATDVMTRLEAVENRPAAALVRLESVANGDGSAAVSIGANTQPTSSWVSRLLSVIVSGPVIGFLLILLLVLAATAHGCAILRGATRWLQRSSTMQAAWHSAKGRQVRAMAVRKRRQALSYLKMVSGMPPAQLLQAVYGHFDKRLGLNHARGFRAPGSRVRFC